MSIKQWVKDETQNMLDQARPGTDCPGMDRWLKYEKEIVKEITFRYNNFDCWSVINNFDQHRIINEILQELENDDIDSDN